MSTPSWTPRPAGRPVAGSCTGRVVHVECGVVAVVVAGLRLRASYDGELLADLARDPEAAPRVGDRVRLRRWADGRTTVQRVVVRAVPSAQ